MVNEESEGKLLSSQERSVCIRFAEGDTLHSQRAQALLAIDDGNTQAQAGQRAGLTKGQVSYWLGKYRKIRLEIFPESFLKEAQADLTISKAETPAEEAPKEEPKAEEKPVEKPREKTE